jgi:hypothetical protein
MPEHRRFAVAGVKGLERRVFRAHVEASAYDRLCNEILCLSTSLCADIRTLPPSSVPVTAIIILPQHNSKFDTSFAISDVNSRYLTALIGKDVGPLAKKPVISLL